MDRRLKLLVLLLLGAVLCLSASIASLALAGAGNTADQTGTQAPAGGAAVTPFVGQNGLWGVRSASGRVLIEPSWYYLTVMNDRSATEAVLIARKSEGKRDRFGLIRSNGQQLTPFLYNAFEAAAPDVWIASLHEDGVQNFHLYHSDGTRWVNASFDSCTYRDGVLSVRYGENAGTGTLSAAGITWEQLHLEYPVGLHRMTLDMENGLTLPKDTLERLAQAAADYLTYLFVTQTPPEDAHISAEDTASIRSAHRQYRGCRLESATVSRVKQLSSDGFPRYLLQLQVLYRKNSEWVNTAMYLTLSRNTAGDVIYSGFEDTQILAAGNTLLP